MAREHKQDRKKSTIVDEPPKPATESDQDDATQDENNNRSDASERRWRKAGVIGTWADAVIRFVQLIEKI